ncbi:MAG: NB-ARC domain-containing protein [Acidobacteriota bacterium]
MSTPEIFISYARSDGFEASREVEAFLQDHGFAIFRDVVSLQADRGWWNQIEEALQVVNHLVLILTPAALTSKETLREWRRARALGVNVHPVLMASSLDLSRAPRRLRARHIYDYSYEEQRDRLIRELEHPSKTVRVPFMVGDLPDGYVERPTKLNRIKSALIDHRGDPITTTVALRGAGGYGKTVLSIALCHDEDIQDAFQDGIIRVELGESPQNLRSLIVDLIESLTGERPGFETQAAASNRLAEVLGDRHLLLVIDDVWHRRHLAPFLMGGRNCARLITTRDTRTLPDSAHLVLIDKLAPNEAFEVLTADLDPEAITTHRSRIETLANDQLRRWPLLLRLVNSQLRRQVNRRRKLTDALSLVEGSLKRRGLDAFDETRSQSRNDAVSRTIEVSLELLSEGDRERFVELSIFPEDIDIPLDTVNKLWRATASFEFYDTDRLTQDLADLSLILEADLGRAVIRLHDVIRFYLNNRRDRADRARTHAAWVRAYDRACHGAFHEIDPEDTYFHRWLIYHMERSGTGDDGYVDRIESLLLDYAWLEKKLAVTGPLPVIDDYRVAEDDPELALVAVALDRAAATLARDPAQLGAQLVGRLPREGRLKTLIDPIRPHSRSIVLPTFASLTSPSDEVRRLTHPESKLIRFLVVDDDRILTATKEGEVQLWSLSTGSRQFELHDHTAEVTALELLTDSLALSHSTIDGATRVFDLTTGTERHKRKWSYNPPKEGARKPDKGYDNESLNKRVTDWRAQIRRLSPVVFVCYISKGTQLDPTEDETRPTEEHGGASYLFFFDLVTDEKLATTSKPRGFGGYRIDHAWTIDPFRLLTVCTGAYMDPFQERQQPSSQVTSRFVLWNTSFGYELVQFDAGSFLETTNGASQDQAKPPKIDHLEILENDFILVFSRTKEMVICFDLRTGNELYRSPLSGQPKNSFHRVDDEHAIWTLNDNRFALFDLSSGEQIRDYVGHTDTVVSLLSVEGRLISASEEGSIRLWDRESTTEIATLQLPGAVVDMTIHDNQLTVISESSWMHSENFDLLIVSPDDLTVQNRLTGLSDFKESTHLPDGNRLVTLNQTGLVQVWDLASPPTNTVERSHIESVSAVRFVPGSRGHVISGARDGSIVVIERQTGRTVHRLHGHRGAIRAIEVSADGSRAISMAVDSRAILWDLEHGESIHVLEGHVGPVNRALFWDDSTILTAGFDGTIRRWALDDGHETHRGLGHLASITALTRLGTHRIATASVDKTVRLWDVTDQGFTPITGINIGDAPDELRRLETDDDQAHQLWVTTSGGKIVQIDEHGNFTVLSTTGTTVEAVVWRPVDDETIELDLASHERPEATVHRLSGHRSPVRSVEVSEDGGYAIAMTIDSRATVWSLDDDEAIQTLEGHVAPIKRALFWDDATVLTAGFDGTIRRWNLENGQELHRGLGHIASIIAMVKIDGRIATASMDQTVRLWEISDDGIIPITSVEIGAKPKELRTFPTKDRQRRLLVITTEGKRLQIDSEHRLSELEESGDILEACPDRRLVWLRRDDEPVETYRSTDNGLIPLQSFEAPDEFTIAGVDNGKLITIEQRRRIVLRNELDGAPLAAIDFDSDLIVHHVTPGSVLLGDKLGQIHVLDMTSEN